MDVTQKLYDWWLEYFERREVEARPTRELLGYANTHFAPQRLTKDEFIRRLQLPWRTASVKQNWLDCFVTGHESEVAELSADVQAFLRDCRDNPPLFLMPRRKTG